MTARKDLILGVTGDLGTALSDRLEDPVGVSRQDDPDTGIETLQADITREAPDLGGYERIYHLATRNSYGHPAEAAESPDVTGTRIIVDAIEELEADERPELVYVSSAAAIDVEDNEEGPLTYPEAKARGEEIAAEYGQTTIVRPGNVYGDGKGVISFFIQQAREGEDLPIYGDGTQERPFVHIDDAADAIAAAPGYDRLEVAEDQYSLNEVADMIEDVVDVGRSYDPQQETSSIRLSGTWQQYETEHTLDQYIEEELSR